MTPTNRSKKVLEEAGWLVAKVEQWIPGTHITRDLFGMFDLLAIRDEMTMGVQVTTTPNLSSRRKKILASPTLQRCFAAGWRVELHGWVKKKNRWQLKSESLLQSGSTISMPPNFLQGLPI